MNSQHNNLETLLHSLFVVCKHLSLHHEENAVVRNATETLMQRLTDCARTEGTLQVHVAKYSFLVQGEPLSPQNKLFSKFAYRMFRHGISSFTISPDVSVAELYAFLRLVMSKSADTWDRGGVGKCLEQSQVGRIQITEMSKSDFLLLENAEDSRYLDQVKSSTEFWNKFARKLFYTLSAEDPDNFDPETATPAELAGKITDLLSGLEQQDRHNRQEMLTQEMNLSILAAQGQKVKSEKIATYLKLAEFVSNLGEDLRKTIMEGICNLQLIKENAESFFNGFSDDTILEAFTQVTRHKNYSSPVMMSLVTRLAGERKLASPGDLTRLQAEREERIQQARELLRADEFSKYVPQRYQKTLMQVLSSRELPKALDSNLIKLKAQLETSQLEKQVARLSLHILKNNPDEDYLEALYRQLVKSADVFLRSSDYAGLLNLCRSCLEDGSARRLVDQLPETFYLQVLNDVSRLGKDYHAAIYEIVMLLGPGFIKPLLEVITTDQNRASRLMFLKALQQIGQSENVIDPAIHYLRDKRWYVVRNILLLLGRLEARDKLPQIRGFLKHDHQRVRQEALKTCLSLKDGASLTQLSQSLSSTDRQEVMHAVSMCGLVSAPELVDKMLVLLTREKLFKFDLDLKKALVQSLAAQKEERALPVFAKKLKAGKIFNSAAYKQFKLEIIKVLINYSAEQATPLLTQQIHDGSGTATVQAKQVMNKLREGEKS